MKVQVNDFMQQLIIDTEATHYVGVFSDSKTFRNDLYPLYKANRGEAPEWIKFWKPIIIKQCIDEFQFYRAEGIEADDVLSILRRLDGEVVFCSPDKDLRQIPGRHYDYSKKTWETVSESDAARRFWTQMLTGDSSDNIPGCRGVGKVGAERLLQGLVHNAHMFNVVREKYRTNPKYSSEEEALSQFHLMGKLLQLLRPKMDLVIEHASHIQAVEYEEVQLREEDGPLLDSTQRSHADDLLCPAADLSEQE